MLSENQIPEVIGADAVTHNGDRIGTVEQVFIDDSTREPVFATIQTGLFGPKETVVPIEQAAFTNGRVAIPYGTSMVKDGPTVDPDRAPDQHVLNELHQHFNLDRSGNPDARTQLSSWRGR